MSKRGVRDSDQGHPPAERLLLTEAAFLSYDAKSPPGSRDPLQKRLLSWARGVASRLEEGHVFVEPFPVHAPSHDDIHFVRDATARAELDTYARDSIHQILAAPIEQRHAALSVTLSAEGVAVSVEVSPTAMFDVKNLRARLDDPVRALELVGVLESLAEPFAWRCGRDDETSLVGLGADELRACLERMQHANDRLWIGWRVPRELAVKHADELDEQLEDALVALSSIYQLVLWSRHNDLLGLVVERVSERNLRAKGEDATRRRPKSRNKSRSSSKPPPTIEEQSDDLATHDGEDAAPDDAQGNHAAEPAAWPLRRRAVMLPTRKRMAHATEVDLSAPIEKGTRVRVMGGPFTGMVGVVQEIDAKGGAKVMLGLLAARVPVKDLLASREGKERPKLSSSHRRFGRP